jgi:RNA polymerase subunit RPABC4/transcription elongation factor Spt4
MTKLTCPKCGTADVQAADEKHYRCTQCGTALGLFPLPGISAIHCPQCQATVLGDALFCHQCGASVQTLSTIQPCPACGQLMPTASSFCPYCGTRVAQPEGETPRENIRRRESLGCPACGRDIGPMAEVCPYCGVNIEAFLTPLRRQAQNNLPKFDQQLEAMRRQYPQVVPSAAKDLLKPFIYLLGILIGLAVLLGISFVLTVGMVSALTALTGLQVRPGTIVGMVVVVWFCLIAATSWLWVKRRQYPQRNEPRGRSTPPSSTNRTFFVVALALSFLLLIGLVLLLFIIQSMGSL